MPQVPCTQTLQRELADCIIHLESLDEIRIILACGAKANEPVTQGLRPLHYAVYKRYIEAVQLLLVRGSEVNARDDVGYSAVHLCAERGYVDLIEILLGHNAQVDFSDHSCKELYPRTVLADEPLRLAIKNGHYDTAKLLLENGANPNTHYFLGSEINLVNPLDVRFLELLLKFGADPNARDRSGLTPLMKASRHPHGLDSVQLLLKYGAHADALASERHDYRSVLHYAVLSSNMRIVNLLLEHGAKVVFPANYKKPTPLDFAILRGNPTMVKFLLDIGADVNATSPLIGSPLHIVCSDNIPNRLEILEILLEHYADPNIFTVSDTAPELKPPLGEYIAANQSPDPDVIHMLLKYGACVVLKSQFSDPRGILKSLRYLSQETDVFNILLNGAQSFNVGAIRRSISLTDVQKMVLIDRAQNALPLKHQVRLLLRTLVQRDSRTLPQLVNELPLPTLLKAYLLYEI